MFCTEAEVIALLNDIVDETDATADVFVAFRETERSNKLQYTATFAIITDSGNEELIRLIVKKSLDYDLYFAKSDINVEDKVFTVDYLYVNAIIKPKLT